MGLLSINLINPQTFVVIVGKFGRTGKAREKQIEAKACGANF
jgi:hypothetical protein